MTRHAINPVIDSIRDGWDDGDKWGSAIGALFDIAEVMYSAGIPVPTELKYRHGLYEPLTIAEMATEDPDGDTTFNMYAIASEYLVGNIADNDLRLAALTLNRYCDMCRAAGLDY